MASYQAGRKTIHIVPALLLRVWYFVIAGRLSRQPLQSPAELDTGNLAIPVRD
jgi:hypothetical protein